jgi:signal transduction histidine kinase
VVSASDGSVAIGRSIPRAAGLVAAGAATVVLALGVVWVLIGAGIGWPEPIGGFTAAGWTWVWAGAAVLASAACWSTVRERPAVTVNLAVALVAWLGPVTAGIATSPSVLRSGALGVAAVLPCALGAALVSTKSRAHPLIVAAWCIAASAGIVRTLTYDPLTDPACLRTCLPLLGLVEPGTATAAAARVVVALMSASVLLLIVAMPGHAPLDLGVQAFVLALALVPWWRALLDPGVNTRSEDIAAIAVLATALAVLCSQARTLRRRRAARSVARSLSTGHQTGPVDAELLDRATRLAWENAQLVVETDLLAKQIAESRRRIVLAADVERERLGRDLHDTVQQRLVGALMHLQADGVADDRRRDAADAVRDALRALRELSHDGFPPVLDDEGLATALRDLDTRAGLRLRVGGEVGSSRCSPELERAGFVAVTDLLRRGRVTSLELDRRGPSLVLRIVGPTVALSDHVLDRVAAAGGHVRRDDARVGLEVVMPCVL